MPATGQQQHTFPKVRGDKTMAIIILILVVLFFALGILSIYTRYCADRMLLGRLDLAILATACSPPQHRGLDPAVIESFPTFAYSFVKGLKIARSALECVVCLSEFRDDETLRLIPECCHLFHLDCIHVWLSTHSTCPVCRANLVPIPCDTSSSSLAINILEQPDPEEDHYEANLISRVNDDVQIRIEPQYRLERGNNFVYDESRPVRRWNSTGHSPVQTGEDLERFTLRLPEEVRERLVNAGGVSRTASLTFERERSGRRGYRARSVGRNERFGGSEGRLDRWGWFTWTPPFVCKAGWTRSRNEVVDEVEMG